MTTRSLSNLIGHRLRLGIVTVSLAGALAAGVWLASTGSPATADVQQTASTIDTALQGDQTSTDDERAQLRKDLKAARELEGQARVDALKKVRADARAGKYGDGVGRRFDRRMAHRSAFLALLPDDLQADIKKVKDADPADRKAMRDDIREKALTGVYGEKVQKAFEILQKNRRS